MAPRRTKIEKIEHLSSREVTFSKRRRGLFNKAEDFSVLYDAEIAVIVFSNTKKLYEFSSTSMDHILSRHKRSKERAAGSVMEYLENKSQHEASSSSSDNSIAIRQLQEDIRALNLDCSRLTGMELDGMSLRQLNELEKEIREGIESVEKRKADVQNYDQPVYVIEDSNPSDVNNIILFSGSSSSGVSDCTESEQSKQFVDTSLHL